MRGCEGGATDSVQSLMFHLFQNQYSSLAAMKILLLLKRKFGCLGHHKNPVLSSFTFFDNQVPSCYGGQLSGQEEFSDAGSLVCRSELRLHRLG